MARMGHLATHSPKISPLIWDADIVGRSEKYVLKIWRKVKSLFLLSFVLNSGYLAFVLISNLLGTNSHLRPEIYDFCIFFVEASVPLFLFLLLNKMLVLKLARISDTRDAPPPED